MFDGSHGDMVMGSITGGRSFTHIYERSPKSFGGDKDKERKIPCHGNFEGTV